MRRVERGLNIARRAVDVAAKPELERDASHANEALAGHLGQVGDLPEVTFEWPGDAGRNRLGTRPRQRCLHQDSRKIDLRERRYRQLGVSKKPGKHDADSQQRRSDWPRYKDP